MPQIIEVPGQGRVEFPDGMSDDQIVAAIRGLSPATRSAESAYNPNNEMSFAQNAAAGFGKAFVDTGRGIKSIGLGIADAVSPRDQFMATLNGGNRLSRADEYRASFADEEKAADALTSTAGGFVGNAVGAASQLIGPGAALGVAGKAAQIPKVVAAGRALAVPTSYKAAFGTGATLAGVQPADSLLDNAQNAGIGAGFGLLGTLAPRVVAGGYGLTKGLLQPLTKSGQERVVGQALNRFASDPASVGRATGELVPGSVPTLGQATLDPGLVLLERAAADADPQIAGRLAETARTQNQARIDALQTVGQDQGALDAAVKQRGLLAGPLYREADRSNATVDTTGVAALLDSVISKNATRPGIANPLSQVRDTLLDDSGALRQDVLSLSNASKNIGDLLAVKGPSGTPVNIAATRELTTLKKALDRTIKKAEPAYGQAQQTFATASAPINQMQVGQELARRTINANNGLLSGPMFNRALVNDDQLVKSATGFAKGNLENTLTAPQLGTVRSIGADLRRAGEADSLVQKKGSDTARNLISQNILRETLGPLGLPDGFFEARALEPLLNTIDNAYKLTGSNQRVIRLLGDVVTDPAEAKRVLATLTPKQRGAVQEALVAKTKLLARASASSPAALTATAVE